jgi:hypothetical protein
MKWIKVNNVDQSTLPPLEHVVWLCYPNSFDNGPVIQLGGRTDVGYIDSDNGNWSWGVLDTAYFARNWEPKLYRLEIDDDYDVSHWAEIEWPEGFNQ